MNKIPFVWKTVRWTFGYSASLDSNDTSMLLRIQRNILFLCVPRCLFWSVGFIFFFAFFVRWCVSVAFICSVPDLTVSGLNSDKNKGPCFNGKHFTSWARRDSHHITCHYALLCILATCDLSGSVELGRDVLPHLAWVFVIAFVLVYNVHLSNCCYSWPPPPLSPPTLMSRNYSDFNDNCRRFICKYFSLERTDR